SAPAPVARSTIVIRVTPGAGLSGRPSLCQIKPTALPLSETGRDGSRRAAVKKPAPLRGRPSAHPLVAVPGGRKSNLLLHRYVHPRWEERDDLSRHANRSVPSSSPPGAVSLPSEG